MTDLKNIIILGAGIGGITAALELRRNLPAAHRITLVDRESNHLFQPSLLWMMLGQRKQEDISRPLSALSSKGIEVIHGEVQAINPAIREVTVDGNVMKADYIIVALGAELAPEAIPGLSEGGHNLYTAQGSHGIHSALQEMKSGRIVILTATPVYKCPAAPYESALLISKWCQKAGLGNDVDIEFHAAEPGPMGVAGPKVSGAVKDMLQSYDIAYTPEHQLTKVEPPLKKLTFADDAIVAYDLLIYVPLHKAPAVVTKAGLTGESGWVAVDRNTLETKFEGIYAVGDVTTIPLLMGKPLPKAGVFAHGEAEVVARNIANEIKGRKQKASFDGHGACFVEAGSGMAAFGSGNFFAEPTPKITLRGPNWIWHIGKILYEKYWLWKQF